MPPELLDQSLNGVESALLPEASVWDDLPDYATLLTARHEAHADTFERMIADLPFSGGTVLDVAIGDGFYTRLLSHRNRGGRTIGIDLDPKFLKLADEAYVDRAALIGGDATALPLADGSIDLVWCAHSLRSLPDAEAALTEWKRVTRPGGAIAILENDRLHEVLLPWPPEVELLLYHAECAASGGDCDRQLGGLHAARRLHRLADVCGLVMESKRSYVDDATPPSREDRAFLKMYLAKLVDRVRGELSDAQWDQVAPWIDPRGDRYLVTSETLEITFIDSVAVMRVPE